MLTDVRNMGRNDSVQFITVQSLDAKTPGSTNK